jgi:hypothetical protein
MIESEPVRMTAGEVDDPMLPMPPDPAAPLIEPLLETLPELQTLPQQPLALDPDAGMGGGATDDPPMPDDPMD